MCNARLDESQTGINIVGRNINNFRYSDDTTLMAENEEELKSLLMRVKEEREKAGLKLNIHKIKIMASGPITSWQMAGETVKTVTDFIFSGSKVTMDGDCSHEIKRRSLLGRRAATNRQCMKSRDAAAAGGPSSQSRGFPVGMRRCESWTIKPEHQRTDAFQLWCWRRLESPLDSKEIKPVHPKGNQP